MNIQRLQEHQLPLLFEYAIKEGWHTEEAHTLALHKTDPNDFFIAYKNESLLGFVVAIKESEKFGFISSLLILKEFRGLGYGRALFEFALEHLSECQIALDSLSDKTEFYEKSGFKRYFDVTTYRFEVGSVFTAASEIETVALDEKLAKPLQNSYLNTILLNPQVSAKATLNANSISSYAFIFKYRDGYKIHIESQEINEALTLFFSLTQNLKKGRSLYLQASKLSPLLLALTEALKMREASKLIRMYNKILD